VALIRSDTISNEASHSPSAIMPAILADREILASMMVTAFVVVLYIVTSGGLITFNKYLMHEDRFPFAQCLVLLHMAFSSIFALLLFLVKPSFFPSLTHATERVALDTDYVLRGLLPIAVLFSASLVLSNTAYIYSSMAFLQMMKEANLALVYGFSLLASIESFHWTKVKIVLMIMCATTLTVHGELNFSFKGCVIQGASQVFETAKLVLQAVLLSNAARKLDVLSFVLLVSPICFAALGIASLTTMYVFPLDHFPHPQWSDIVAWWPLLAANASLAFALNVIVTLLLKRAAAVGFILAGITKDVVIIVVASIAMHEHISMLQVAGFCGQLCLVCAWSLMKAYPDEFEDGVIEGLLRLSTPCMDGKGKEAETVSASQSAYGTIGDHPWKTASRKLSSTERSCEAA
jgi:hypothetical protein